MRAILVVLAAAFLAVVSSCQTIDLWLGACGVAIGHGELPSKVLAAS